MRKHRSLCIGQIGIEQRVQWKGRIPCCEGHHRSMQLISIAFPLSGQKRRQDSRRQAFKLACGRPDSPVVVRRGRTNVSAECGHDLDGAMVPDQIVQQREP
jgi:hypothetical protein